MKPIADLPESSVSQKDQAVTREVDRTEWRRGEISHSHDEVVVEVPVALVYNGVSHVVMMVTPADFKDFALGFSLSEGILQSTDELLDFEINQADTGLELNLTILNSRFEQLKHRRRNLTGRTGCGLCGAESLAAAIQIPKAVTQTSKVSHDAIDQAISRLPHFQPMQNRTGGIHAAAWCSPKGEILLVREDVGRHNALDKLIGAIKRHRTEEPGFILMTSRASYEIVVKTAVANIPVLATVSAPTALAIDLAGQCGVTLVGFTSVGRHVVYTGALLKSI